jgi:hypothetical protein
MNRTRKKNHRLLLAKKYRFFFFSQLVDSFLL